MNDQKAPAGGAEVAMTDEDIESAISVRHYDAAQRRENVKELIASVQAEAQGKITNLELDIALLRLEKKWTACAYCTEHWEYTNLEDGAAKVAAHVAICPNHPMRTLEAEVVELRKDRARLDFIINCCTVTYGDIELKDIAQIDAEIKADFPEAEAQEREGAK